MSKTSSLCPIAFIATIVATGGCKKSTDGKPAPATSMVSTEPQKPTAKPTATAKPAPIVANPKPAVVPATCSGGRFGGGDVPFCLALPPGYNVTEKPAKADAGWWGAEIARANGDKLVLHWFSSAQADDPKEVLTQYLSDYRREKGFAEGEISDGRGRFVEYSSGSQRYLATVALSSDYKILVRCDAYPGNYPAPAPDALEACKTLMTF